MKDVLNITHLEQAKALINPVRVELVRLLEEPKTCAELADALGVPPQRINHHLKELLKYKLIRVAKRRKVRNLIEATYEAEGRTYWLSPRILREGEDPARFRDRLSLSNLLVLAESIQEDVGTLLGTMEAQEVPSLGISAEIALRDDDERNAFSRDLLAALEQVFNKYKRPGAPAQQFLTTLMCYPKPSTTGKGTAK